MTKDCNLTIEHGNGTTNKTCVILSNYMVLNHKEKMVISWICYLTGPITFLENILVLVVIGSSARLRQRPSYLFIGSLALADVLASCFFPISFLAFHISNSCDSPKTYLLKLAGVTMAFTGSVGSLLLTAMDRYICIHQAPNYKLLLTHRRATLAIVALWAVAITISFLPLMGWRCKRNTCSRLFPFIDQIYLCSWTGLLLAVLVFILMAYALIMWRAHQHEANMRTPQARNMTLGRQVRMRLDIHLAQTLGLILLILVVCWLPVLSFMVVDVFQQLTREQQRAFAFCCTLCLVNSAINPLLYALRCRELRRAFMRLLGFTDRFRPWMVWLWSKGNITCIYNQGRGDGDGQTDNKESNISAGSTSEVLESKQPD
ncbi:cannabinoid receptor 2 [Electrophorus electricus]|uniref:cannabinoid receptor 2 n=1 Tax=Electrophorus electricus TaxID=8005 RepID=UPI0015CFDF29|nr:cannabinoid receptor 2 [Electrophorus electricus]